MKKVPNTKHIYAFEDGRLYSMYKKKFLKLSTDKYGYLFSGVANNEGKLVNMFAHRMVAMVYLPNPNNLPQINHINKNRNDNRVSNLEWCTGQYNTEHGQGMRISLVSPDGELISYLSIRRLCRENNLNSADV